MNTRTSLRPLILCTGMRFSWDTVQCSTTDGGGSSVRRGVIGARLGPHRLRHGQLWKFSRPVLEMHPKDGPGLSRPKTFHSHAVHIAGCVGPRGHWHRSCGAIFVPLPTPEAPFRPLLEVRPLPTCAREAVRDRTPAGRALYERGTHREKGLGTFQCGGQGILLVPRWFSLFVAWTVCPAQGPEALCKSTQVWSRHALPPTRPCLPLVSQGWTYSSASNLFFMVTTLYARSESRLLQATIRGTAFWTSTALVSNEYSNLMHQGQDNLAL